MKLSKILAVFGFLAILKAAAQKAGEIASEHIALTDYKISDNSLSFTNWKFKLTLTIENRTGIPAPIDSFDGSLVYGLTDPPTTLSNLNIYHPVTIPGNDFVEIPFLIDISFLTLGESIVQVLTSGDVLRDLLVTGTVKSNGVLIPIELPIDL